MGVGATVKGITLPQLKSLSVPLPSHNEQRRIVDILKRADGIRRLRKQAQDTARQLIPALFIEMFGDPVANPKEWVTKPLQELLLSIDSGWSPKCDNQSAAKHEWGVLKLSAVTYGEFIEQENKALPAGIDPKLALEVHAGDVLFTRKNTKRLIAATVLVKQTRPNLMLSDLIFRLRIADDNVLLPEYLWALLSNPIKRSEIQNLATGAASSMPNISKKKLMTVEIPIAPAGLQKAFATSLENIHSVFGQQKMAGLAAESAFQSLLYRCFSGSVD
jgi:type I restriction enzyme S subunit